MLSLLSDKETPLTEVLSDKLEPMFEGAQKAFMHCLDVKTSTTCQRENLKGETYRNSYYY